MIDLFDVQKTLNCFYCRLLHSVFAAGRGLVSQRIVLMLFSVLFYLVGQPTRKADQPSRILSKICMTHLPVSQLQRQRLWVEGHFALGAWSYQQRWLMFLVGTDVCVKNTLLWLAHSVPSAGQQQVELSASSIHEAP